MPEEISQRVLNEAYRQSIMLASRMVNEYKRNVYQSWDAMAKRYNIAIPDNFRQMPFNYANISIFIEIWKNGSEARIRAARSDDKPVAKIHVERDVSTFGELTLKPEQEGTFRAIKEALYTKGSVKAAINDGLMGSGKTYLGAALIADRINQGVFKSPIWQFKPHWFIIITPKGVMETWKRCIDLAGLSEYLLTRKILVMSNAELNTNFGDMYCHEEIDEITDESSYVWEPMLSPDTVIVDECHNYIRPGSIRTKKLIALIECKHRPKILMLSATLAEKVNDGLTYVIASDIHFNGQRITKSNFSFFARTLDKEPHKPSLEGVKRLRRVLNQNIFSFPYVKPKFKAVNRVWLVDFERPQDQRVYDTAIARYQDFCKKVGKGDIGQVHKFVQLTILRKTVEPLRVAPIARRVAGNYREGKLATAVGCSHIETVAELVFRLTDEYNIPREKIAIVWGGKREYQQKDLLSKEEIDTRLAQGFASWVGDYDFVRRMKISMKYLEDKVEHGETTEEQARRHIKLKQLGLLGKQGDNARQIEVDNFQDGTAVVLIFTIDSGGVGLSFDRDKEILLPREGIFTPIYNGKQFQQGLGRLVRRASISGANQFVCMLNGTIESEHIAPILDIKLKTSAAMSNRSFSLVDLYEKPYTGNKLNIQLRDEEEARKDAENEEELISDHGIKEDDEDENPPESLDDILE